MKDFDPSKYSWHYPPDDFPKQGDHIIAKLSGCKIGSYFEMKVREGEGVAHLEKWTYLSKGKS